MSCIISSNISIREDTCEFDRIHVGMYISIYVCMSVCLYVCMYVFLSLFSCLCVQKADKLTSYHIRHQLDHSPMINVLYSIFSCKKTTMPCTRYTRRIQNDIFIIQWLLRGKHHVQSTGHVTLISALFIYTEANNDKCSPTYNMSILYNDKFWSQIFEHFRSNNLP